MKKDIWKYSLLGAFAAGMIVFTASIMYKAHKEYRTDNYPPPASPSQRAPMQKQININSIPLVAVNFKDMSGNPGNIFCLASADGRIALPVKMLSGYSSCEFLFNKFEKTALSGCREDSCPIVTINLGNIYKGLSQTVPHIAQWNNSASVSWQELNATGIPRPVKNITVLQKYPKASSVKTIPVISTDGVFMQGGNIIGYSFKDCEPHSYLWMELPDDKPGKEIPLTQIVNDYRLQENIREIKDLIAEKNVPCYIKLPNLCSLLIKWINKRETLKKYPEMNSLTSSLSDIIDDCMRGGYSKVVADSVSSAIIEDVDSKEILSSFISANIDVYGYGIAIKNLFAILDKAGQKKVPREAIIRALTATFLKWIGEVSRGNNPKDAIDIYVYAARKFPENPDLNLAGVNLYVKLGLWNEADAILSSHTFPEQYNEKILFLKKIVGENINLQNSITIKFTPGAPQIPVQASVNGRGPQPFILDTGATYVTIPESSASTLGIDFSSARTRIVATAAGSVYAKEVILKSITIENYTLKNIPALVMNLPSHPGEGLLGLSFLNRFHVMLNSGAGEIRLIPKEE